MLREISLRLANSLVLIAMIIFWPVIALVDFVVQSLKTLYDALELEVQLAAATRRTRDERKRK